MSKELLFNMLSEISSRVESLKTSQHDNKDGYIYLEFEEDNSSFEIDLKYTKVNGKYLKDIDPPPFDVLFEAVLTEAKIEDKYREEAKEAILDSYYYNYRLLLDYVSKTTIEHPLGVSEEDFKTYETLAKQLLDSPKEFHESSACW